MELMCPHCHSYNQVSADGAAETARFICAGCGTQFEAMLVEGALVPVLPRESGAPAEEFFDILSIPRQPLAEPPQELADLFVVAGDPAPGGDEAATAAAHAPEADPFHITEPAAESTAPPAETVAAEVSEAEPVYPAAPAHAVDRYAVGMRVLRISPMWLLLSSVGFFAVLLTMSWLSKPVVPVGEAIAQLPNQATSPATAPAAVAQVEQAKAAAEISLPQGPRAADAPPATPAAPSAGAAPPPGAEDAGLARGRGNYTVQVGSYSNPSEANEHVSRLRAAGFEARAVAAELPKRGTWYRVQAGRFEMRDEAAKAGAQLRAKGLAAGAIVTTVDSR